MKRRLATLAVLASAALLLAGCSGTAKPATSATPKADKLTGAIVVDAAASLTGTFDDMATAFKKLHPGVSITFNYGGSSALAAAIVAGAPVDIFAAASPATMQTVTDAKLNADTPTIFVHNILEIAVPAGNPAKITGIKDFADKSKKIALCAAAVPCGAAALKVFAAAKITPQPDTLEQDVKAALTKVSLDEVDAAMVYHTDVLAAGSKVEGITFPEAQDAINDYPIATLTGSKNAKLAKAWEAYVLSAPGQKFLTDAGFEAK